MPASDFDNLNRTVRRYECLRLYAALQIHRTSDFRIPGRYAIHNFAASFSVILLRKGSWCEHQNRE